MYTCIPSSYKYDNRKRHEVEIKIKRIEKVDRYRG